MSHEHTDLKHAQLFPFPKKPIKKTELQSLEEYRQARLEILRNLAEERAKERRQSLNATLAALIMFAGVIFFISDIVAKRAETAEACRAFRQEMAQ